MRGKARVSCCRTVKNTSEEKDRADLEPDPVPHSALDRVEVTGTTKHFRQQLLSVLVFS